MADHIEYKNSFSQIQGRKNLGFSVIEMVVGLGLLSIIALGTSYSIQSNQNQMADTKKIAEKFHAMVELKNWLSTANRNASQCQALKFSYTNIANLKTAAGSENGAPFSVQVPVGTDGAGNPQFYTFKEGVDFPGSTNLKIQTLRFSNAQVVMTGAQSGANRTYLIGKVRLSLKKAGSTAATDEYFTRANLGQMTIGFDDLGGVQSCAETENRSGASYCVGIQGKTYSTDDCVVDPAPFYDKDCLAGKDYAGFDYETNEPICVNSRVGCMPSSTTGKRRALKGFGRRGTGGNEGILGGLNGEESVAVVPLCADIGDTPPVVKNLSVYPPSNLDSTGDLGAPGSGGECSSVERLTEWYNACMELKKKMDGKSSDPIVCPSPPTKCFETVKQVIPETIPTRIDTPTQYSGSCYCGSAIVANGQYCGSYFNRGYDAKINSVVDTIVYQCLDGQLAKMSNSNYVLKPKNKTWTNGDLRRAVKVKSGYYDLQ